ncbi:hypothetical protein [Rubellimicrobium aerolatum]|uniref:Uncharacterized protein n=1 Tax=Rubellimicrobium aerolatum TaxID=490979 RepID=A0ABW0SGZ5_9RHOB|nr:hypothetical protein [Rubellimicrobium aerolatum]MBP1807460.1 hypothetical protein [Rubellimicrobium aerolatum]
MQMPNLIDPSVCLATVEVFRKVPEIRLRIAIDTFREFVELAALHLDGVRPSGWADYRLFPDLRPEDLEGLILIGRFRQAYMTPKGARLLKRLIQHDLVPRRPGAGAANFTELDAYINLEAELVRRTIERRAQKEAGRQSRAEAVTTFAARVAHLVHNPEDARPEELSRKLIMAVFLQKFGKGVGGSVTLGGIRCFKGFPQDDPAETDWEQRWQNLDTIYWLDATGFRHGDLTARRHRRPALEEALVRER